MSDFATKDIVTTAISVVSASLAAYFSYQSRSHSRRSSNRELFSEGQRLVSEINRILLDEPLLWGMFHTNVVHYTPEFQAKKNDVLFKARIRALAHQVLSMFEHMLKESPEPNEKDSTDQAQGWIDLYHDTLASSAILQWCLENEHSSKIFRRHCYAFYHAWKQTNKADAERDALLALPWVDQRVDPDLFIVGAFTPPPQAENT